VGTRYQIEGEANSNILPFKISIARLKIKKIFKPSKEFVLRILESDLFRSCS